MIIFPRLLRASESAPTQPTALSQPLRMHPVTFMQYNSIRRFSTPRRAPRCSTIMSAVSAVVPETGRWMLSLRTPSGKSGKKSVMARFSSLFRAVSILPLQPVFSQEPSASSLPACSLTTAFSVRMRAMRLSRYSVQTASLTLTL